MSRGVGGGWVGGELGGVGSLEAEWLYISLDSDLVNGSN